MRKFYIAAYDISNHRRRAAALALVRGYATGGQKSVHEVFLSPAERGELLHNMALVLDAEHDRFLLLRLDASARCHTLGKANSPADPDFFYVG
jgi:CRISPR-associated protein Cas2